MLRTRIKYADEHNIQTEEDLQNPSVYLSVLHSGHTDDDGQIFICNKNARTGRFSCRKVKYENLSRIKYDGIDMYASANTFFYGQYARRREPSIRKLDCLFVDIDIHEEVCNTEMDKLIEKKMLELQCEIFNARILPEPTFIVNTGRGLHLVWKLRNEDKMALPRWRAAEKHFVEALVDVGADANVSDASRVLRIPGTINSVTGTEAKVEVFNNAEYSLYQLCHEYDIPYDKDLPATEKQRRAVEAILKVHQDAVSPNLESRRETSKWLWTYRKEIKKAKKKLRKSNIKERLLQIVEDMIALQRMRSGKNCPRELMCVYFYQFMLELVPATALAELIKFNDGFEEPLSKRELTTKIRNIYRRYEQNKFYKISAKRLGEIFGVTQKESAKLMLVGRLKEKKVNKYSENSKIDSHKRYLERFRKEHGENAKTKSELVLERRKKVWKRYNVEWSKRISIRQLARQFGVSKTAIEQDIEYMRNRENIEAERKLAKKQAREAAKKQKEEDRIFHETMKSEIDRQSRIQRNIDRRKKAKEARAALREQKAEAKKTVETFKASSRRQKQQIVEAEVEQSLDLFLMEKYKQEREGIENMKQEAFTWQKPRGHALTGMEDTSMTMQEELMYDMPEEDIGSAEEFSELYAEQKRYYENSHTLFGHSEDSENVRIPDRGVA